jgi:hypothetical protein
MRQPIRIHDKARLIGVEIGSLAAYDSVLAPEEPMTAIEGVQATLKNRPCPGCSSTLNLV